MLSGLFGDRVTWDVARPADEEAPLPAAEHALTTRMVERRRREFTAGRTCARRALTRLGFPASPVLMGARREPLWPPGVVGSIAHCRGFCGCALAHARDLAGLGLDAEPVMVLQPDLLRTVSLGSELDVLATRQPPAGSNWGAVLFVAKEALFKAQFPLVRAELGFRDIEIRFLDDTLEYRASQARPQPPEVRDVLGRLRGRVLPRNGLLLAGAVILTA